MPGVDVGDRPRRAQRRVGHPGAQVDVERGRRRLFHELLMPPLDRAFPLEEVDQVAVRVADDLHLDVPRLEEVLLHIDVRHAERRHGLVLRGLDEPEELVGLRDDAHAATAAPAEALIRHRVADPIRGLPRMVVAFEHASASGDGRHAGAANGPDRLGLVSHPANHVGARTDERQSHLAADLGEMAFSERKP